METKQLERLTALGHAGRMAAFRLLVRRYPEFLPSGELARILDAKANTMSVHLTALLRAGLIEQRRDGRNLNYRADMDGADDLVAYLFQDCCRGRPEICVTSPQPFRQGADKMPEKTFNALFICTGNSARSLFAEALLRERAGKLFTVFSAGTHPAAAANPFALDLLRAKGHDTSVLRPKSVAEFAGPGAPRMDFVFTVCDQAANEECPAWEGQPISGHWGLPDPVKATGTDAEKALAFQHTYGALARRIDAFSALPFATLDRIGLQAAVDDIAGFDKDK